MFGLQAAAGIFDQFANKQPLGLVVRNIVVASATAPTVRQTQLLPAIGGVDRAAELLRVNKGFGHHYRMAIASLPIGAEPIQGQAQDP